MSQFVHSMLAVVLLVGIAGCGGSAEKPATESSIPKLDPVDQEKQMEIMKSYHQKSQSGTTSPPAGEGK